MAREKSAELNAQRDAVYEKFLTSPDPDRVWPPWAAARYIGIGESTMAQWRKSGNGPAFIRLSKSKCGYRRKALVAYLESREFASTSSEAAANAGNDTDPAAARSSRA